ncbi:hypothetical protein LINGRAHAP2_LOCUS24239 [Linum grandiflorum]
MAPRRKNQEGYLPQTSVEEEQVASADAGHGGGSSNNLVGEVAPPQSVPSVDLRGAPSQMMEENRKMMEEDRQLMVETRQFIKKSFNRTCPNIDRKMDQLFEGVNKNKIKIDELKRVLKPMMHSRALPKGGRCLTPKNARGNIKVLPNWSRVTKPWHESMPSSMTRKPPIKCATFTTHVEQPLMETVTQKIFLKARPHMASLGVRIGGDSFIVDQLPPRTRSLIPTRYDGCKLSEKNQGGMVAYQMAR